MSAQTTKPNVSKAIIDRLKALDDLPHFPEALMQLEKLLASGEVVHMDQVAQVIAKDPRLAAGLIGVVNTAKYSVGTNITDLPEAMMRIGLQDVRLMAHAINYKSSFKSKPPFSEKHFMKHALLAAFLAQGLAKVLHVNAGEAFLCGLMHDIGIYLLAIEDRDKYLQVMALIDFDIAQLPAKEHEVFGTHHALMSARLLQQWKFPKQIIMGVAGHHTPEKAVDEAKAYAFITFLAEQGCFLLGVGNGVADLNDEYHQRPSESMERALEFFSISYDKYRDVIQETFEATQSNGMI